MRLLRSPTVWPCSASTCDLRPWTLDLGLWTRLRSSRIRTAVIPVFHFSNTSEIGTLESPSSPRPSRFRTDLTNPSSIMLSSRDGVLGLSPALGNGHRDRVRRDGNAIPPFKCGMDRLWVTSMHRDTFGDFNSADLDQFLKVKDSFRTTWPALPARRFTIFSRMSAALPVPRPSRVPRPVLSPRSATGRKLSEWFGHVFMSFLHSTRRLRPRRPSSNPLGRSPTDRRARTARKHCPEKEARHHHRTGPARSRLRPLRHHRILQCLGGTRPKREK